MSQSTNNSYPNRQHDFLRHADKIIAAEPEKHRAYHASVLKGMFEQGLMEGMQFARNQINPDGNPEIAVSKIQDALDAMMPPQICKACGCTLDAHGCGCNPHDA